MRTIDNYINEVRERRAGGRFKNSGADIDIREIIKDFVRTHMHFCNGDDIVGDQRGQIEKFVPQEPTDGKYFLSSKEFTWFSSMQSLRLEFSKDDVKNINPHVFDLISTDLRISELIVYPGTNFNDIPWEGIKEVWPDGVFDLIKVNDTKLKSLGDLPKHQYGTSRIYASGNDLTSLAGCPRVYELEVCDNPKLVSLAGSDNSYISKLNAYHCDLKTLAGAPRSGDNWDLSGNPRLSPSDDEVARVFVGSKMEYLKLDSQFFKNITNKKVFKDARIDELNITFDEIPTRSAVEAIVKVLPLKINLITMRTPNPKNDQYLASGERFKDVRDDILSLRYKNKRPFMRLY